ncbi:MAG TPA: hypothetical protein VMT50_10315 [Steroidobacteraceae bacterium]|nr:hypothetical protein [Steroidobacteraceae bacterium]
MTTCTAADRFLARILTGLVISVTVVMGSLVHAFAHLHAVI